MDRWIGKVAIVTGASSGIGAQIVIDLLNAGMIVVGLARRVEPVEELKSQIYVGSEGVLHAVKCDVTSEYDVKEAFKWTIDNLGGVDVLVNNAGIARNFNLIDSGNTSMIKEIIDTNVMAVALCTREAFQSMKSRNFDGHIFVINSIAGHRVPNFSQIGSYNMYAPSKYAVTAMTEVLRQEFQRESTRVKITSISPGIVKTGITAASGVPPDQVEEIFKTLPFLDCSDISQAVIYALSTKPHVQVHEIVIKPIGEKL